MRALESWARSFAAQHGRAPVVFFESLCADDTLSPAELLAHAPTYLNASARLLLLVGPSFASELWNVGHLWCWRALGRQQAEIDVALVGRSSANASAVVASFDAFHLSHAVRCRSVEAESVLRSVFAAATVARVNRCVRDVTALVAAAADELRASTAPSPRAAAVPDEPTTCAPDGGSRGLVRTAATANGASSVPSLRCGGGRPAHCARPVAPGDLVPLEPSSCGVRTPGADGDGKAHGGAAADPPVAPVALARYSSPEREGGARRPPRSLPTLGEHT